MDVAFAAVKIRLDHRAHHGRLRAHAFHEFHGPLGVHRAFHINAQKAFIRRGALGNRKHQPFAEFHAEVQAELRQFAGDIGVQLLLGDAVINIQVGVAGLLCIRRGGHVLPQAIQGHGHTGMVAHAGGCNRLIQGFSRNKAARHTPRRWVGCDPMREALTVGEFEKNRAEHGQSDYARCFRPRPVGS